MNQATSSLPIAAVRFVKELYPRLNHDDAAIDRYRAAIDRLPPIAIARDGILVDGYHRWQAHQREGLTMIAAENLGELTDAEIITESIRRNATHGQQLSLPDKRALAGRLWSSFDGDGGTARLAELLAVSPDFVTKWSKDARLAAEAERHQRAYDLWLDGWTFERIANELGVSSDTIGRWVSAKTAIAANAVPDNRQHFDLWPTWPDGGDSSYFGRMPAQVVENLLWLYTQPGDMVVDPFAGSGTTIKVARRMGRLVWASDLQGNRWNQTLPITTHDITTGWPSDAPAAAKLILLDPPYWKQAAGRYSDDARDLGNKSLDEFLAEWMLVIQACGEHLADDGRLAFIVSPAQDGTLEAGRVVDLAFEMYRIAADEGLTCERRIIVPYSTQQATGQQVEAAREHRKLLKLYRDLVVMRG